MIDDEFVAVRDVAFYSSAHHRSEQFLDEAHWRGKGGGADISAEARIVEHDLLGRIDRVVRMITRDAIHLIDVADPLLRAGTAVLAGPIRKDNDVLRHQCPR
jgi:hypothetical protein